MTEAEVAMIPLQTKNQEPRNAGLQKLEKARTWILPKNL